MKKQIAFVFAVLCAGAVLATPATIPEDSVSVTQNLSHRMFVNYTLENGPAIVTFELLTNGVSIGDAPIANAEGDVFKKVESGEHSFMWNANKGWPGHCFPKGGDVAVSVRVIAWDVNCAPNVMVIDLMTPSNVMYYASLEGLPRGVQDKVYKTDKLVLRKIPAEYVVWKMGSPSSESGYNRWNETQLQVTLTKDYYLGVYEVTQKQWYNIKGTKPAYFNNPDCWETRPVEQVGYSTDAAENIRGSASWPNGEDPHKVAETSFFGKLRTHSGLDLLDFPTEAQWEYACRAGVPGVYYTGLPYDAANAEKIARYAGDGGCIDGTTAPDRGCSTDNGTAEVGSYEPNIWGLYDMLGNVSEWVLDIWKGSLGTDPVTDPIGNQPQTGNQLNTLRGGSWKDRLQVIRCGSRSRYLIADPYQSDSMATLWNKEVYGGFRVCLHLQ